MADVNGDGYADIVVGANAFNHESLGEGRVDVFLSGPMGLPATASWSADPTDGYFAEFGTSVANAGDVNRVGLIDLAIGAPGWNGGSATNEGRAYVYMTSPPALPDGGVPDAGTAATTTTTGASTSSAATGPASSGSGGSGQSGPSSGVGGAGGSGGAALANGDASNQEGGCGCRMDPERMPSAFALLALGTLLAALLRRSRLRRDFARNLNVDDA